MRPTSAAVDGGIEQYLLAWRYGNGLEPLLQEVGQP